MRKLNSFLTIFSFFIFFSGFSCSKIIDTDGPLLPPATHSGAQTMGFLLNGKRWVADSDDFKIPSTDAKWGNNTLYVEGISSSSGLLFSFQDPKVGEYHLKNGNSAIYTFYNSTPEPVLIPDDPGTKVTITYFDGKIIAGTFTLVFKRPSGEALTITKGRFDITISN